MRHSEKILLSFLLVGIVGLGSFVSWKYYEKSNSTQNASQVSNLQEPSQIGQLEVSSTPFYEIAINKNNLGNQSTGNAVDNKREQENTQINENDNFDNSNENLNINQNSNQNANLTPARLENKNTNKNKNRNSNNNANSNSNIVSTDSFTFAVLGDTQQFDPNDSNGAMEQAVSNIGKMNPDLVMTEGDLVSSCDGGSSCKKKYDDWKNVIGSLYSKTKEIVGNHDRTGKDAADKIWQDEFDLPTNGPSGYSELAYSFDYKNAHFVVLDSEKPSEHIINQDQRDWLEKDLANETKDNTFVFFHEPAYPVSSKIDESLDFKKEDRDALWGILKNHQVTAVFSGHEHIMSRKNIDGIYQFVIGNTDSFDHDAPKAGMAEYSYRGHHYATVTVKGKEVVVNIYKVDGSQLNSFTLPQK